MKGAFSIGITFTLGTPGYFVSEKTYANSLLSCSMTWGLAYTGISRFCRKLKERISSMPAVWSLCSCVNNRASSEVIRSLSTCCLKSGPESMIILFPSTSRWIDALSLLSLKSKDLQTSQEQPITGTPCEVPEPNTVTITIPGWFEITRSASWHFSHWVRIYQFQWI